MDAGPVFTTLITQNRRVALAPKTRGFWAWTPLTSRSEVMGRHNLLYRQERDGRMTGALLAGAFVTPRPDGIGGQETGKAAG